MSGWVENGCNVLRKIEDKTLPIPDSGFSWLYIDINDYLFLDDLSVKPTEEV